MSNYSEAIVPSGNLKMSRTECNHERPKDPQSTSGFAQLESTKHPCLLSSSPQNPNQRPGVCFFIILAEGQSAFETPVGVQGISVERTPAHGRTPCTVHLKVKGDRKSINVL